MKLKISFILAASLIAGTSFADIARDIREGGAPIRNDGGYLELGLGYQYLNNSRIENDDCDDDCDGEAQVLLLSGAYSYKGVFIEFTFDSVEDANIGFNFLNTEHWSWDLLASNSGDIRGVDDSKFDILSLTNAEKDLALIDRDTDYGGAGIRATGYWGDTIFQYRLVAGTGKKGITSSARLGRSWQAKNWNFHAIASAGYNSKKTNQYLFGVTPDEATERFSEYSPDASVTFSADAGVSYPLSKRFVWRSFVRESIQPGTIKDSPLIDGTHDLTFITLINFVF